MGYNNKEMRIIRKFRSGFMYQTDHQRKIQQYFMKHPNQGFTPKMICDVFADSIHQATVYRNLARLEEAKIVRKVYLPNQENYTYQYIGCDCTSHLHLICQKCGKTIHLECEKSFDFLNHVMQEHQFNVDRYQSIIVGLCKECCQNE